MSVQLEVLKNANYYAHRDGHISLALKNEIDDYIDSLSDDHYVVIPYSSFDQGASTDWVFSDSARTATNSSGVSKTLITSTITTLSNVKIKGVLLKATDKDVTIQISKDGGSTFYNIDSYDCDEEVTSSDTLVFAIVSGDNVINEFKVIYDQLY
jgi:hypothetical protein